MTSTLRLSRRSRHPSFRPALETLEARDVPAVFTVTNVGDYGAGSLAQAIVNANGSVDPNVTDSITFDIAGNGPHVLYLNDSLPAITDRVIINGYSQPGAAVNTLMNGSNAQIKIVLDGRYIDNQVATGLTFSPGSEGSLVYGLAINNFEHYGLLLAADDINVYGNFIGIDPNGVTAAGNGVGVAVLSNSNSIGEEAYNTRNVISGNLTSGVTLDGDLNVVQGNRIGVAAMTSDAVGNGIGVAVYGSGNLIGGGFDDKEGNIISGNLGDGVRLTGSGATNNSVYGNSIGTWYHGAGDRGNGGNGIAVLNGAAHNNIGKSFQLFGPPQPGNYIANNVQAGVHLEGGNDNPIYLNLIFDNGQGGVRVVSGVGHTIQGNSIFSNSGPGINLVGPADGANGGTANDFGDGDFGANDLQNYPVLASATITPNGIVIAGSLQSKPNSTYRLHFYATLPADGAEGDYLLGSIDVTTNAVGSATFTATLDRSTSPLAMVTGTATDTAGNTSEFSAHVQAKNAPPSDPGQPNQPGGQTGDVGAQTQVAKGKVKRMANGSYRQKVIVSNVGGAVLKGPVYFVLDGLNKKIKLKKRTGVTKAQSPVGSSYRSVGGDMAAGESRTLILLFTNPNGKKVKYTSRVLAGIGTP